MSNTLTITIEISDLGDTFKIKGVNPSKIDVTSIKNTEAKWIDGLDRGGLIALDLARQLEFISESDTDALRARITECIVK